MSTNTQRLANKTSLVTSKTRNLYLPAFYTQHIPNHANCREVCIQPKKDTAPNISINRRQPRQRQIKT